MEVHHILKWIKLRWWIGIKTYNYRRYNINNQILSGFSKFDFTFYTNCAYNLKKKTPKQLLYIVRKKPTKTYSKPIEIFRKRKDLDLQRGRYRWNPGSLYILVPRRGERHKGLNSVNFWWCLRNITVHFPMMKSGSEKKISIKFMSTPYSYLLLTVLTESIFANS